MSRCAARLGLAATLGLVAALALTPAGATEKVAPESRAAVELSYAPVVKKAAPAVVNIYTRKIIETRASPLFDDPFFQRFFGENFSSSVPRQRVQNSLGSGVIVSADGLIVTNHHVIAGSDQITVVLGDGREFDARVVLSEEHVDLALLRIDTRGKTLPVLAFRDSDDLEVGDIVLAIGNPFGVGQTVTSGIVSALARTHVGVSDMGFFIQTDAAINPGNSGGALVTMDGRLAGINSAIYSRSGGSIGIGFAIPSNMVAAVVAAESAGGKLAAPWIGVGGQTLTADLAEGMGLDHPGGLVVNDLYAGGPAMVAGLKLGDVVVAVNGREVKDWAALRYRLATMKSGTTVTIGLLRRGQNLDLPVAIALPPEEPARHETPIGGRNALTGAVIANLSPAVAEEMGLAGEWRGVVVKEIARGSIARRAGFAPGDVILEINAERVGGVEDVLRLIEKKADGWEFSVRRNGEVRRIVIG